MKKTLGVVFCLTVLSGLLTAQGKYAVPKTAWGDPDLQEIWSTEDLRDVPYERPDSAEGRALLTDEEFARRDAVTKRATARGQTGFGNGSKTRTFRQTSLIVDGDGKYPRLTPGALKRFKITDIGTYGGGPFLSAADFNLYDRCITRGVVGSLLPVAYGNGLQIFQTPNQVVINYEMVHETRVIPLDGRPHVNPKVKLYMGDARGHWEGQTLVVETTNFTSRTSVGRRPQRIRTAQFGGAEARRAIHACVEGGDRLRGDRHGSGDVDAALHDGVSAHDTAWIPPVPV